MKVTLTPTAERMLLELGGQMHDHVHPTTKANLTSDDGVASFAVIYTRLLLIGVDSTAAVKTAVALVVTEFYSPTTPPTDAANTGKEGK